MVVADCVGGWWSENFACSIGDQREVFALNLGCLN